LDCLLEENSSESSNLEEHIEKIITNVESEIGSTHDALSDEHLKAVEPNVLYIGESSEKEGICDCGRSLKDRDAKRSGNEVQVLLLSAFPFAILITLLLFPIVFFWPAQDSREDNDKPELSPQDVENTNLLTNGAQN